MERFTFKKTHPYYKPGEEFPCIVAEDLTIVAESNSLDDVFYREFRPKEYAAGSAIDRLYDYEELGYTPCELRDLLESRINIRKVADTATNRLDDYEKLGYTPNELRVKLEQYEDMCMLVDDYEALEFTPEELRGIIDEYHCLKRMATSPSGLTRKGSPDDWKEFVKHAIDRASKDKNVSVSVFFRENDVSVTVYPWPEEDESDDNG